MALGGIPNALSPPARLRGKGHQDHERPEMPEIADIGHGRGKRTYLDDFVACYLGKPGSTPHLEPLP
jgi:hypothetical protein